MREGWQQTSLGEAVTIASGQVDPKEDAIADLVSVGPDNLISGGGLSQSGLKTARELGQISGKYAFDAKAILYSKIRPNLNKAALPNFAGICSADMYPMWVSDPTKTDRSFIYYVLTSERFVADATSRSFRTGMPKINRPDLETIEFPLPPLSEQRKIAAILRTWEEALEKLNALRAAKARQLDGLAAKLIHDDQVERLHLRGFLKEKSSRNRDEQVQRVLSVTNSAGFVLAEEQFAHRVASASLSNYKIVRRGQYAYNPSRINVGSIARLDAWDEGALSPMYVVFQVQGGLDADFFGHWLRSAEARQRIALAAQGSVRETVSFGDLGSILVPVPTIERQKAIAKGLNAAQAEISLLDDEIKAVTRQKRGLMQKLLTGEWRVEVSDDEEAAA
ncbi:restriction endonuclease subunit S [Sulfitobacter sp. 1A12779]|uniref:restriction endonuclease subunit S n=1 Tax=Sulfitobacter sp. 1A12779 TaxID=3368599 RepID=UPI003745ECF0